MHLVHVVRRYWPAVGGVEMLMHHVINALARNHQVTVLASRIDDGPTDRMIETVAEPPEFAPFFDGNARIVQLRPGWKDRARMLPLVLQVTPGVARYAYGRMRVPLSHVYAGAMQRVIASHIEHSDIVHAWSADLLGAAGLRSARASGVPFVITPFVHPGQWGEDPASARVYRRADAVIGLLEAERAVFSDLGVRPESVAIAGACTPGVSRGGGREIRQTHGITGPLILFVGARRPYKGHDLLCAASDAVFDRHPDATFAFVGPGAPLDLGATRARIIDVGETADDERAGWLEAADLMCLPSAHEIFPISVLEAFSAKTAVLLSDLPPLRELIDCSGGGEVTDRSPDAIAAAILDMLASPSRLVEFAEAGHRFWSSRFTPEAVARTHENVYKQLTERNINGGRLTSRVAAAA